jgi:hypothetical protein
MTGIGNTEDRSSGVAGGRIQKTEFRRQNASLEILTPALALTLPSNRKRPTGTQKKGR